ncbi:hypothetical protein C8A05DRAFT_43318 [Staphylotrichum tortipilum]|uniref:Uncharacterized protein n=1 Tax=Staphylotrichum tortipilum TaxID=2831512 RepID=A0AAN6MP04_9PEZI|nr:hypothetical protein C8A05DRAFT_43318 [Staphylotrichum longicolle]
MSKNGNITSFFRPVPKAPQSPPRLALETASSPASSSSSTPPPPSPTPLPAAFFASSPPVPSSTARDRNSVIRGSDDDDDDDDFSSDDEFPDLFAKPLGTTTLPPQPAPRDEANVFATPRPKRRALEFHLSPLTINTRHKFDIKALLKHAAADNAVEESELRTAALLAQSPQAPRAGGDAGGAHSSLHDNVLDILSDPEDSQEEAHRDRLLRAVKRTEATAGRRDWYFFDRPSQPNGREIAVRAAFPASKATGAWAFLAPEKTRAGFFEDGLPYNVQCRLQNLPDEIFEWVLDEAPNEKSKKLRDEYLRLLGACSDQARRLLDEDALLELFQNLGATDRALAVSPRPNGGLTRGVPFPEHDRMRLRTVFRLLGGTAHALKIHTLTRTLCILLRLGIDNIVREDQEVAVDYQDALLQVVLAVPRRSWDSFCGDACSSLYSHTHEAALRWNSVSSIPLLHPRLADLRRRMALVSVFDDPRRAFSPPEETFSIRSVLDRLDDADQFVIDRNNTDYPELLALSEMLSIAVGDGGPPPPTGSTATPEAIKHHNAEVDELAHRIKFMWSNIHEQGAAYMSRLEVRVQLRDFERKLQHVVRTRPPPKQDIFGLYRNEDEVSQPQPKQQSMRKFLFKTELPRPTSP